MCGLGKYFSEARQRAKRRKDAWNLLLIPLGIAGVGGTWVLLALALLRMQQELIPDDVILASYTRIGSILMFVSPCIPSLAVGMLLANLLAWCVKAARVTFEKEGEGIKGASFAEAMKHLCIAAVIVLVIFLPVGIWGAFNYFYVAADGVHVNPLFSFSERHYKWVDIESVSTRCLAERDNLHLNYVLGMKDGAKIDLMQEPRLKFVRVYDEIKPYLQAQPDIRYSCQVTNRDILRLKKRYSPADAEQILRVLGKGK